MDEIRELPAEYSPDEYKLARNGVIISRKTNKIVAHHPEGSTTAITKENSTDYHRIRQQKKLEGLLAANCRLTEVAGSPGAGWSNIAGAMYDTALDDKSRVAAVQAARLLGEMTGFLSSGNGKDDSPVPAAGARLELGPGALNTLLQYISQHRQAESGPQPEGG